MTVGELRGLLDDVPDDFNIKVKFDEGKMFFIVTSVRRPE